ncbi:MAG: PP2C family protein-serine/threonine phosphatase [Chloroflexota bacterium]
MKPAQHLEQLDLGAVVRPFDELGDALLIAVEDAGGRHLAGAPATGTGHTRAIGSIRAHGEVAGRVVLHGPSADSDVVRAVAAALGGALSIAAGAGIPPAASGYATTTTLEEELAHGRRLQRTFVSLVPPDVPGYDLASHYEAAREVGGDFFDLFRLRRRGRPLSIVVADVTGKGVAAALLMAFARPLLHAAIDHAPDPATALERTNTILAGERRTGLFITALCARLDPGTGVMRLANAGHEPPLFVPGDGSPVALVLGSGPLMGAFAHLDVPEVEARLSPGDVVLFYTDGVTDARSPDGERFEEERLMAAVQRARGGTAHDVVREVSDAVTAFAAGTEPADDITIVAVGRHRQRVRGASRRGAPP